jgi:hypothetical protein
MVDSVICWKWSNPGYRSQFDANSVMTLKRMVERNYRHPHRFICVTNEAEGLDCEVILDDRDFIELPSPHKPGQPSCYRRLRAFRPDIAKDFGNRFVMLDLDCVITGDVAPLWNEAVDFAMYEDPGHADQFNGSMLVLSAGARPQVWKQFDPGRSPALALEAGYYGSDQGWISYILDPKQERRFGRTDGLYSYRRHIMRTGGILPDNARIVFFHGAVDPWSPEAQALPWVAEHYR